MGLPIEIENLDENTNEEEERDSELERSMVLNNLFYEHNHNSFFKN